MAILLAACVGSPPARTDDAQKPQPTSVSGFLPKESLRFAVGFVPPPPAPGSAAQAADDEAFARSRRLKDTARWKWAVHDSMGFPQAAGTFSCALGIVVNETTTPHLYTLLRRTLMDAGLAGAQVKSLYKRPRPFVAHNDPICTPESAESYRRDPSYPSSNAATGWAWALVLSEIAPERSEAILRRGYAYGESRLVCGVHWQSDVAAGRMIGAAVVARLHANPEFAAEVAAARSEVAAARADATKAPGDCAAESEALSL